MLKPYQSKEHARQTLDVDVARFERARLPWIRVNGSLNVTAAVDQRLENDKLGDIYSHTRRVNP